MNVNGDMLIIKLWKLQANVMKSIYYTIYNAENMNYIFRARACLFFIITQNSHIAFMYILPLFKSQRIVI